MTCANACPGCTGTTCSASAAPPSRPAPLDADHNHGLPPTLMRWATSEADPRMAMAQAVQMAGIEIAEPGDTAEPRIYVGVGDYAVWLTPATALDVANALRLIAISAQERAAQQGAAA